MIALSLDNALNLSGWAVWENSQLKKYGTFQTKSSETIENRLAAIWDYLTVLWTKYNFTHIFFEDVQKQTNTITYQRLCYVQAIILLWCQNHKIPYTILSPSHWRKVLNTKYGIKYGRSRADQKAAAQEFVKQHYSLSLGEDICDAINLGHAGLLEYKKNESAF